MRLTDIAIRTAKPKEKPHRMSDGAGLYLEIAPSGGKWWRFKYRFGGKEKRISLGVYPDVPLAGRKEKDSGGWIEGARDKREKARQLLAAGIDPGQNRKAAKSAGVQRAANSFEVVAREWFYRFSTQWEASHTDKVVRRMERDVFPWIGSRPLGEITAAELLSVLRRIEARGAVETAHRALQTCGQILLYAVATGRADRNIAADLRGSLPPAQAKHHASIVNPKEVGALLRAIDAYKGSAVTKSALLLAPLVFVRPGELRMAEWTEINLDKEEWRIPARRMKMRQVHIVPLSTQATATFRELYPFTGTGRYVFPGVRTNQRPMSENTVNAALRRLGFGKDEMTGHGFRSMASTLLNEQGWNRDAIERQLAHSERNAIRAAYNYAEHIPERRKMMQAWADYLDSLRMGAEVIPLKSTGT